MDIAKRFDQIAQFLTPFTPIWDREILHFYPHILSSYSDELLKPLFELSDEELWQIDGKKDFSSIAGSKLEQLFSQMIALSDIPVAPLNREMLPKKALYKVKKKKVHEIESLSPTLAHAIRECRANTMVDIGGGVGHLSRIMTHYHGIRTISIDKNSSLQQTGRERLCSHLSNQQLRFEHITFGEDSRQLDSIFTPDSFTVGLHTCGPLAVTHLKESVEHSVRGLINFGCCYLKITSPQDINLSQQAKQHQLAISNHALTLATRGQIINDFEDFLLKKRVKLYRYMLHLLLYHQFDRHHFVGVGDSSPKLYQKSFAHYAGEKLKVLNIKHQLTAQQLEHFFHESQHQDLVKKMFLMNIFRWQFGRVVELFILLDRALYLKESGLQVEINRYFDENISPRNIGILAKNSR